MPSRQHPRVRRAPLLAAALAVAVLAGGIAERPAVSDPVERLAQPFSFALLRWEVEHLLQNRWRLLAALLRHPSPDEAQARQTLARYFALAETVRQAEAETRRLQALDGDATAAAAELSRLQEELHEQQERAEAAIAQSLGQLLREEGLSTPLRLPLAADTLFPPVSLEFEAPPKLLVLSPRERIELSASYLLRPDLSLAQVEALEAAAEAEGPSALVVSLGGLATYPSMVSEGADPRSALSAIAHEWLHHYLFFHPLGRRYDASYEMRTINETVASMAGDELADMLMERLGLGAPPSGAGETAQFDFAAAMRETRLRVDELLTAGRVEEAEAYMRLRQRFLAENGYYIRRLNQAYFAFHGSYADSPASVSPIGEGLRQLRSHSPSVGDFVRQVQGLRSYEELQALLKEFD